MCGLRQEEIFGLRVHDVDFLRGIIHIRQQVIRADGRAYFGLPKYGKIRDVPLDPIIGQLLAAYLALYSPVEVTLPWSKPGGKATTGLLVVTRRENRALDKKYINNDVWKPALRQAG